MEIEKMGSKEIRKEERISPASTSPRDNLIEILIYALAMATALGINDLAMMIFNIYFDEMKNKVISKVVYVTLLLVTTLSVAYFLKGTVPL